MNIKIQILLLTFLLFVLANNGYGQIFLDKGKVEHTVTSNSRINGSIMVHNTSDKEMKVRTYWEDFLYIKPFDGSKKFLPTGSAEYSMGSWINFSPREFSLPPYAKKEVSYTINVPSDINGGYQGVLFVEKEAVESNTTKGLSIVARVGCLFFLDSDRNRLSIDLSSISFNGNLLSGMIENTGNVLAIPKTVYYILDAQGIAADRGEMKNIYLPPNESAHFEIPIALDLADGRYTMVTTFDLSGRDVVVREVDFTKDSTGFNIIEIRD